MINFIRAILKAITGTTNRFFTADGRPDEVINGKMYQHYGFRSTPHAGTELMTMQYGNNTVSVAENDGKEIAPLNISPLVEGEVRVYSNIGGKYNVVGMHTDGMFVQSDQQIQIMVTGSTTTGPDQNQVILGSNATGQVGAMSLITINFYNLAYKNHVHSGGVLSGALTGPPVDIPETVAAPYHTSFVGAN